MTTVSIDGRLLPLAQATDEWITEMLARHGKPSAPVCVRVDIAFQDIRLSLTTPGCLVLPDDRTHNQRERRIIDAWEKRGLHTGRVEPAELGAFLRELEHLL